MTAQLRTAMRLIAANRRDFLACVAVVPGALIAIYAAMEVLRAMIEGNFL